MVYGHGTRAHVQGAARELGSVCTASNKLHCSLFLSNNAQSVGDSSSLFRPRCYCCRDFSIKFGCRRKIEVSRKHDTFASRQYIRTPSTLTFRLTSYETNLKETWNDLEKNIYTHNYEASVLSNWHHGQLHNTCFVGGTRLPVGNG